MKKSSPLFFIWIFICFIYLLALSACEEKQVEKSKEILDDTVEIISDVEELHNDVKDLVETFS